jgi:hypothetical protein
VKEDNGGKFGKYKGRELSGFCAILLTTNGGDLASTWVAKPEVHAEVQDSS